MSPVVALLNRAPRRRGRLLGAMKARLRLRSLVSPSFQPTKTILVYWFSWCGCQDTSPPSRPAEPIGC